MIHAVITPVLSGMAACTCVEEDQKQIMQQITYGRPKHIYVFLFSRLVNGIIFFAMCIN